MVDRSRGAVQGLPRPGTSSLVDMVEGELACAIKGLEARSKNVGCIQWAETCTPRALLEISQG
jgi:hypothetical protein